MRHRDRRGGAEGIRVIGQFLGQLRLRLAEVSKFPSQDGAQGVIYCSVNWLTNSS